PPAIPSTTTALTAACTLDHASNRRTRFFRVYTDLTQSMYGVLILSSFRTASISSASRGETRSSLPLGITVTFSGLTASRSTIRDLVNWETAIRHDTFRASFGISHSYQRAKRRLN